jgi:Protein of unknown function (DUF2911)
MNRLTSSLVIVATTLLMSSPLMAQRARLSSHDTTSGVIGGDRIMIIYGRPHTVKPGTTEVRKIWGGLVPWGKIWRTGADEATLLVVQEPIAFGSTTIPTGCYSLWTLPNEDGTGQLIINKQIGQWGEDPADPTNEKANKSYDPANDVARIDLKKSDLDKTVDQFTMAVAKDPDVQGGGLIELKWENTQYAAAFTVAKTQQ